MKIGKLHKIELAASKDQTRAAIVNPYLDRGPDGDKVIATNGRILAVLPVECDEKDVSGYVPRECLKDARTAGGVVLNGVAEIYGGASYPRDAEWNFPNWRQVMPDYTKEQTVRLAIDAALLKALADAIGAERVCLEFPIESESQTVTSVIAVKPYDGPGCQPENPAHGVIMPCRV